jgi:flagellar hook protein FlgE
MLRSLDSGISAMQQFQTEMDVIGNNIANVNTTGYKASRVDFADALSQTLQSNGAGDAMQIGTGVGTDTIATQFSQGALTATGNPSDLYVSGNGFFVVRDPADGQTFATRAGNFQVDSSGYLITAAGMRVQGYNDAGLTSVGDLQIDASGAPGTTSSTKVDSYAFSADGTLTVKLDDGTTFTRGQVLLQTFNAPEALHKEGGNLYSNLAAAGPLDALAAPKTNGAGSIIGSALESSNVDLTTEFSSMITAQRAFEASSKIISTSDEMLQTLVNLKR